MIVFSSFSSSSSPPLIFSSANAFHQAKQYVFVKKWGSMGTGDGQFNTPYGVDVDSAGNVWVVERNGDRVQKFDKDGNFVFKFGSLGAGEGQFDFPRMVAVA
jgi:DNA-binding beta-propeller fold protein YncE